MRHIFLIALLIKIALLISSVAIADISGPARVTDGDTIKIGTTRIRLHGIDAPEKGQNCEKRGQLWRCGQVSTKFLRYLINSQTVTCIGNTIDRYKRLIAVCYANGIDLNAALVDAGLALAYRKYSAQYVPNEENARQAKKGMWAGSFVSPWDWRRGKRLNAGQSEDQGKVCCKICQKGKACGSSCISKSYVCTKPPGCSCNKN